MHSFKILFPPSLQSTEKNRLAYCSQLTFLIWVVTTLKIPSTVHPHNSIIVPVIFCLFVVCLFFISSFFVFCFFSGLFCFFSFFFCFLLVFVCFVFAVKITDFVKRTKVNLIHDLQIAPRNFSFILVTSARLYRQKKLMHNASKLSDRLLKLCSKWCKIA